MTSFSWTKTWCFVWSNSTYLSSLINFQRILLTKKLLNYWAKTILEFLFPKMPKPSKLAIYFLISLVSAGFLLYQTFSKEYVSVSLALTKMTNSKWKNAIIFNAVFATVLAIVTSLIKFFFGEMREIERYV